MFGSDHCCPIATEVLRSHNLNSEEILNPCGKLDTRLEYLLSGLPRTWSSGNGGGGDFVVCSYETSVPQLLLFRNIEYVRVLLIEVLITLIRKSGERHLRVP